MQVWSSTSEKAVFQNTPKLSFHWGHITNGLAIKKIKMKTLKKGINMNVMWSAVWSIPGRSLPIAFALRYNQAHDKASRVFHGPFEWGLGYIQRASSGNLMLS